MSDEGFSEELYPNDFDGERVSDLKVMKSAAGWYIGRSYWDQEFGFDGPYSRESGYYGDPMQAQEELDQMTFEVRNCLENNWAYENGTLEDIREEIVEL